ncbi:hypothetical protein SAMN05518849_12645 [Sphingobium sp. AP50]|uniref:hypothetical protein n=1 Tax=Sphingobium sp. AP50 TaxID=1884369 RepID=UPI0008B737FF|nr:hypothetical protein [Sphingobium sp. AP50]SEK01076.1 hypothetical protein SAMN05518849_12645 [Sphingobium sp. AP50]
MSRGALPTISASIPRCTGYIGKIQAQVWEDFITSVLALLRTAGGRIARGDEGYDYKVRKGWFGKGQYKILGTEVALPLENAVTDALTRACETIRRDRRPNHFLIDKHIFIASQQPRETQEQLGDIAFTTDIKIASSTLHYLDLRIEAKRLLGSAHAAEYCGTEGLLRFAHSEPYTSAPLGMMLGYTFRYDDAHWHSSIQTQAAKHGVTDFKELRTGRWTTAASLMTSPGVGDVLVLHVMLSFESKPSVRELDGAA